MSLFHHVSFKKIDPLDNGLAEEIAAERQESEAIVLDETIDEGELSEYWQTVEKDIEKDPEWFRFTEGK